MTKHSKISLYKTQDFGAVAMPVASPAITAHPFLSGTTTTWTITTGGNFNAAANWSNGVPASGIDAVINEASTDQITVTITGVSDTADSLSTQFAGLNMSNATLTLQGALGAGDGSSISTGTGTALAQSGGLLDFQNGPSGNDSSYITAGGAAVIQTSGIIEVDAGTLTISGNSSFGGTITGAGDKPDTGIVILTGDATYNFTSTAALSVGTLELVNGSTMNTGGTLTYLGNFIQTGGTTLNLGAYGFTLDDTSGTTSALGGLVVGTTLLNQATLGLTGATMSSGMTFSNSGTLLLNDGGGTPLTLGNGGTAAALVKNAANASISVLGGTYLVAANNGTISNLGSIALGVGGSLTDNAVLTNSSTISVGAADTFSQNNNFTNSAVITGAGVFQLTSNGIDTLSAGSSISVGTFALNDFNDAVTLNINGGTITSPVFDLLQGGTVVLGENLSYVGTFNASPNAALLTVNLGTNTLSLTGTNAFTAGNFSNIDFDGTGTLSLAGTSTVTLDGFALGEGAHFVNSGLFDQGAGIGLGDINATAAASNSATGTWDVVGNFSLGGNVASASSNPNSTFANAGTFEMTAAGDTANIAAIFTNTGILSASNGALIDIADNFSNAGTITGAGEVEMTNGTSTLGSGSVLTVGTLATLGSSMLALGTSLSYAGVFTEGSNAATGLNLGSATLTLTGTDYFGAGNTTVIDGPGKLALASSNTTFVGGSTVVLGDNAAIVNTGDVTQDGLLQIGDNGGTSASVTNTAAGTWTLALGNGISRGASFATQFTNAGLFQDTELGSATPVTAVFSNAGSVVVSGTELDFYSTFTNTGKISGTGAIGLRGSAVGTLAAGTALSVAQFNLFDSSTLDLSAGFTYAGVFNDAGYSGTTVNLGGHKLTLSKTAYFGSVNAVAYVDGPGTLSLSGTTTITDSNNGLEIGGSMVLLNSGHVTQNGQFQIGDSLGASTSVTNSAKGTWAIATGAGISTGSNGSSSFANLGHFENTGSYVTQAINAVFTNSGVISVAAHDETDFYNQFSNTGTISGAGVFALNGSATGTFAAGEVISVSEIGLYSTATLDLATNLAYAGFFNDQGYNGTTVNLSGKTLTLSGTANIGSVNNAAFFEGPGTLSVSGAATITSSNEGLVLGSTADLVNSGYVLQNGGVQIGDNTGALAGVTNAGTWAMATNAGLSTGSNGNSSFTNTGLLENTGNGDSQSIAVVLTNSGTLSIAAGDATSINSTLANTGTISGAGGLAINGTATFSAGESISVAEIGIYNSATLNLATNLSYSGFFNDQGYNGTSVNLGANALSLTGKTNLGSVNNAAYIDGTGTFSVSGATTITATNNGLELGSSLAMVNSGAVLQNGNVQIGDGSGALASITNTGTWAMATSNGLTTGSNGSSSFTNKSLLENTGIGDNQSIAAVLNNAATWSIAAGDTDTINGLLANTGTISGGGGLAVDATATFSAGSVLGLAEIGLYNSGTINIAANLTYGGLFNDQGYNGATVNLASNTLSLTGNAIFGSVNNAAYIEGAGTLSLSGSTTITDANNGMQLGGSTALVNSGTVTQTGGLQIGDGSGDIATVTNSATGTWRLGASNSISTGNDASSSFSNAGLVTNIGTGNSERITAVFNNTGTLTDTNVGSAIVLAGGGSIGGTLTGAGEIDFENGGVYTLATAAALNVATIGLYNNGTDLTLAGAASYAGTFTEGAGAILNLSTSAAKLTLTGQDTLDGSVTGSGTVLLSTGGVLIADNLTIGGSAMLKDSGGTIAQAQNMTIGDSAASSASLSIAAGSTYEITGDVTIASQGLGAITNAGSFAMLAGSGTTTIDPAFTNTGTVSSSSGTLVFAADVTNNKLFTATNGHELVFDGAVSTTGSASGIVRLTSGGLAVFGGFVGSAETLTFADGSGSAATLNSASTFDGTISGFSGTDSLTLGDFENAKASYSGGILTLTGQTDGGTATTVELHFAGSYTLGSFTIQNNGTGGTVIVDPKN